MNIETEKRILELARKLKDIDQRIAKSVAEKGVCGTKLRDAFHSVRDELKELLSEAPPLTIRDPEVKKTLRKVREEHFYLDKEVKKFLDALKNLPPDQVDKIYRTLGIDKEEITSEVDWDLHQKFHMEIFGIIDPEDYFENKGAFSTIIVGKQLPNKINAYFDEIRQCFLFGNRYAAIGLCRVLIEIIFRDKCIKLGLRKEYKSSNIIDFDKDNVSCIIREVCKTLRVSTLKEEAVELYRTASEILHGKDITKE